MSWMQSLQHVSTGQTKSILRDSMSRNLFIFVFALAFLTRWLLPWVATRFHVDLVPHYPLVMSVAVVFLAPVVVGYLVGMVLLDERDEGTLQAVSVTPFPTWRYLVWKLAMPVAATTAVTLLLFPILNVMPFSWGCGGAIVVGAMWAPLLALLMSCFAANKIQGFVLMRVSNVLLIVPVLAWFFPHWETAVAFFPAYWPMKSLWLAAEGKPTWVYDVVGLLFHSSILIALYRRFTTVLRAS